MLLGRETIRALAPIAITGERRMRQLHQYWNKKLVTAKTAFVSGFDGNLAPDAFHLWAKHYYKCCQDFEYEDHFSPVPYFLLCRAIELELKSRHLSELRQKQVKGTYNHRIAQVYADLPASEQILSSCELDILKAASEIYASKGFEYFTPEDALTGFSRFPDLTRLDAIAKKLLSL